MCLLCVSRLSLSLSLCVCVCVCVCGTVQFNTARGQGRTTATKEAVLARIPLSWKTPTGARAKLQLCIGGAHLDSTASPTRRIKQASTIFKAFGGGTAEATEAEHLLACDVAIVNADFNPRGIPGNPLSSPATCFDRYISIAKKMFRTILRPMFLTEILGQPGEGDVDLWTGNMTPIVSEFLLAHEITGLWRRRRQNSDSPPLPEEQGGDKDNELCCFLDAEWKEMAISFLPTFHLPIVGLFGCLCVCHTCERQTVRQTDRRTDRPIGRFLA